MPGCKRDGGGFQVVFVLASSAAMAAASGQESGNSPAAENRLARARKTAGVGIAMPGLTSTMPNAGSTRRRGQNLADAAHARRAARPGRPAHRRRASAAISRSGRGKLPVPRQQAQRRGGIRRAAADARGDRQIFLQMQPPHPRPRAAAAWRRAAPGYPARRRSAGAKPAGDVQATDLPGCQA